MRRRVTRCRLLLMITLLKGATCNTSLARIKKVPARLNPAMKPKAILHLTLLTTTVMHQAHSSCIDCPPGAFCGGGTMIVACQAGTFESSNQCLPCPPGRYTSSIAQTACLECQAAECTPLLQACAAGSYSPRLDAAECVLCPYGTFSTAIGAVACAPCAYGSFSGEGAVECVNDVCY
jgi:hypothetical protein